MQTNSIKAYFVLCVGKITVCFESHSRHISTTGLHKYRVTLFFTVANNTCGFSEWNILHVNDPVDKIVMCLLHSVKCPHFSFTPYGIDVNVNVGIFICLCLIINICFLYPIEHNTFTVCIHLFSTACFGRFY
jgi:hypothetical protein